MNTKNIVIGIVVLIIIVAIISKVGGGSSSSIRYIERITEVDFPAKITNVSAVDNTETFVTAHVTIPQEEMDSFIKKYSFVQDRRFQNRPIGTELLDEKFRQIPASANYVLIGQSIDQKSSEITNRWVFVMDKNTGDLWVTLFYLDRAGDVGA